MEYTSKGVIVNNTLITLEKIISKCKEKEIKEKNLF